MEYIIPLLNTIALNLIMENARIDFLLSQMQKQLHVDEPLKARDQIAWVCEINNIYKASEEIVLKELIYH